MKFLKLKHNHKWIMTTPFTITKDGKIFARICIFCKCGKVAHKHLPSLDEVLKEEEEGEKK